MLRHATHGAESSAVIHAPLTKELLFRSFLPVRKKAEDNKKQAQRDRRRQHLETLIVRGNAVVPWGRVQRRRDDA